MRAFLGGLFSHCHFSCSSSAIPRGRQLPAGQRSPQEGRGPQVRRAVLCVSGPPPPLGPREARPPKRAHRPAGRRPSAGIDATDAWALYLLLTISVVWISSTAPVLRVVGGWPGDLTCAKFGPWSWPLRLMCKSYAPSLAPLQLNVGDFDADGGQAPTARISENIRE